MFSSARRQIPRKLRWWRPSFWRVQFSQSSIIVRKMTSKNLKAASISTISFEIFLLRYKVWESTFVEKSPIADRTFVFDAHAALALSTQINLEHSHNEALCSPLLRHFPALFRQKTTPWCSFCKLQNSRLKIPPSTLEACQRLRRREGDIGGLPYSSLPYNTSWAGRAYGGGRSKNEFESVVEIVLFVYSARVISVCLFVLRTLSRINARFNDTNKLWGLTHLRDLEHS